MRGDDMGLAQVADTPQFYADLVMRHSSDAVIISDPERKALWVNPAFTSQTGYGVDDIAGKEPGSVLQGRDTDADTARLIEAACAQRREIRVDILNYTKSGAAFWVDLRVTPVYDSTGRHTHFISTMRDITERKMLEDQNEEMRHAEALRQSERQLLALTSEWLYSAKSFDELLMVIKRAMHTLIPEADGALYVYDASRTMLELVASWGTLPSFAGHILPDDCWALRRGRAYAFGLKPIEFVCDHVKKPGTPYFCLPIIAHGETIGLMHIVFDGFEEGGLMRHMRNDVLRNRWDISLICAEQISLAVANVRLRQELQEKSLRDALTGLWNRRWFMENALREVAMAERDGHHLALVSLDVDHFKQFNDTYGHETGDMVLKEVAQVMMAQSDKAVAPCRLGGEEFILLCLDHDEDAAIALAERVRVMISEIPLTVSGQVLSGVTVSAGIGLRGRDGTSLEEIMKASDMALYRAKAEGRNRVVSQSGPQERVEQT
ncbi:bifunctional diguanylate cyclase/phosphodiesterase [Roseinatronobacter bogoriensis]|uniref:Sensor domain-containing diguanylate cyclase n=1 Tax=Roseinatronobacter bogoriensis subsp. barguzinensis TaxID=441209 RepID=A0A2K8KBW9_9RHOB|nr:MULTISPECIES: diguanylate cyclase [Rhodobaca]ATX66914.1 sensor domain-containing diguanylate cyclase [Rhodobaca barguzinensis]MBB4206393.1 diguanylate cyclase (GGDEF)-like protein/PAS domain S-box-containing protein [Rhodobaca bogoriensis DSM 18756]TDW41137.1 PAS domain S-box-containing protein/diguanylate cyclase (GGDEF)-like protein [Rhodobaca barguzinensis]TDY74685.1 PAS domain S-box-containing protein/diguanylate cyclase (GGDEF)-like protein [Rhodobaca bogoriensis DSM 18756]